MVKCTEFVDPGKPSADRAMLERLRAALHAHITECFAGGTFERWIEEQEATGWGALEVDAQVKSGQVELSQVDSSSSLGRGALEARSPTAAVVTQPQGTAGRINPLACPPGPPSECEEGSWSCGNAYGDDSDADSHESQLEEQAGQQNGRSD